MIAISTILMMIASETFLSFTDATEASGYNAGQWLFRIRTTAAGELFAPLVGQHGILARVSE